MDPTIDLTMDFFAVGVGKFMYNPKHAWSYAQAQLIYNDTVILC